MQATTQRSHRDGPEGLRGGWRETGRWVLSESSWGGSAPCDQRPCSWVLTPQKRACPQSPSPRQCPWAASRRPHRGQLPATACRGLQGICREKPNFTRSHAVQAAAGAGRRGRSGGGTWPQFGVATGVTQEAGDNRAQGTRASSSGRCHQWGTQVCLHLDWTAPRSLVSVLSPEIPWRSS